MKYLPVFVLIVARALVSNAQDYKSDFAKATSIYNEKCFEVQMEYLFYPSFTAGQPSEKQMILMKRQGQKFYMNQFGLQTIYDENYVLIIDDASRMIAIDKKNQPSKSEIDPKVKDKLNEALKGFALKLGLDTVKPSENNFTVSYLGIKNGKKGYAFNYKDGEYEKNIFYLDEKKMSIENIIIYYRQPQKMEGGKLSKIRVEINFVKQNIVSSFPKETFNLKKYVDLKQNGKVIPQGKYSSYTLINHLAKPSEKYQN